MSHTRDTAAVLLDRIAATAEDSDSPSNLKMLAEAYAAVVTAMPKPKDRPGVRVLR